MKVYNKSFYFCWLKDCMIHVLSRLWELQLKRAPLSECSSFCRWKAEFLLYPQRHLPHWHQSDLHTFTLFWSVWCIWPEKLQRLRPAVLSVVRLIYVVIKLLMISLDCSQTCSDVCAFADEGCACFCSVFMLLTCEACLQQLCWSQITKTKQIGERLSQKRNMMYPWWPRY